MRVLHVVAAMDPKQGGVSQAVRTMIMGLADLKINNEVASLDAPGQDFLIDASLPVVHALGPAKGPWSYGANLVPWLVQNFSRFNYIILHGLWLYPGFAIKKALGQYTKQQHNTGKKLQCPKLLIMPHGMLDPYFQQASGRKLKALRNNLYWKLIEGDIVNKAYKILFTTAEERMLAKDTFSPYRPKAEAIVGLGVEKPPSFSPLLRKAFAEKCPGADNSSYILFLSRIHEKKGIDLLVKAYASILQQAEGIQAETGSNKLPKLVIAGPGLETVYGQTIQGIVNSSPLLQQNVLFTGMITGNVKWGAFYGCEAFILPSHQENFGIAVVEAMACLKPVLITDRVNIWREIKSAGSGIVMSPDVNGVNELLTTWFKLSDEEKILMGKNAFMLFTDSFTVAAASGKLSEALQ